MNKHEAEKLLRDNGYETELREGILFVLYNKDEMDSFDSVRDLLRSNGYDSSFGTEGRKNEYNRCDQD